MQRLASVVVVVAGLSCGIATAGRSAASPNGTEMLPTPGNASGDGEFMPKPGYASADGEYHQVVRKTIDGFPKAHPLTERVLEDMTSELSALKGQDVSKAEEHGRLASSVDDTISHANGIPHLRSEILEKEADITEQERHLRGLEREGSRLKKSHAGLTKRLHLVLDPKVAASEQHLQQQQAKLANSDKVLLAWKAELDKSRAEALTKLQQKQHEVELLHQSEAALAQAQRQQVEAQNLYDNAKITADKNVEEFRYVQTNYEAGLEKEKQLERRTRLQEKSVKHLRGVLNMEAKRIKESYVGGAERLQGRIRHSQGKLWSLKQKLTSEKDSYRKWKAEERTRIEQTAARKVEYEASAAAYAASRHDVLESAEKQASRKAEGAGDWADDDWAWGEKHNDVDDIDNE